jgi:FMN-dependent NADH-azoreductase
MNKRKFLKTIISFFGITYFSPIFLEKIYKKKFIKKNKFSKVWFLHIDDFR